MSVQHYCDKAKGDDKWVDGPVTACKLHGGFNGKKQLGYREGPKSRAKKDRAAGSIGTQRGDYRPDAGSRSSGYISG